jgi:hypothetical protein
MDRLKIASLILLLLLWTDISLFSAASNSSVQQSVSLILIFTRFSLYLPKTYTDDVIESVNSYLVHMKAQRVIQLKYYQAM